MAKQRLTDKAERMLKLLMAMRHQRVRRAAALVGYTDGEMKKGWSLLSECAGIHLDAPSGRPAPLDDGALARLDLWENEWYPVIDATLAHNFPDVHATVFNGLRQTSGSELVITVGTLLERLADLPAPARELLAGRDVTDDVLAEAQRLLASIQEVSVGDLAAEVDAEAEEAQREGALEAAEAAMWSHYLEWSQILRARVKNRRYLRLMGFSPRSRAASAPTGGSDGAEGEVDDLDDLDDMDEGATVAQTG